jgi:hypothetical protein
MSDRVRCGETLASTVSFVGDSTPPSITARIAVYIVNGDVVDAVTRLHRAGDQCTPARYARRRAAGLEGQGARVAGYDLAQSSGRRCARCVRSRSPVGPFSSVSPVSAFFGRVGPQNFANCTFISPRTKLWIGLALSLANLAAHIVNTSLIGRRFRPRVGRGSRYTWAAC